MQLYCLKGCYANIQVSFAAENTWIVIFKFSKIHFYRIKIKKEKKSHELCSSFVKLSSLFTLWFLIGNFQFGGMQFVLARDVKDWAGWTFVMVSCIQYDIFHNIRKL